MINVKSRTKYIIIVLFLLVIAGMWFYHVLFSSPAEALRRAENFIFTRMTVAQLGEQGTMMMYLVRDLTFIISYGSILSG